MTNKINGELKLHEKIKNLKKENAQDILIILKLLIMIVIAIVIAIVLIMLKLKMIMKLKVKKKLQIFHYLDNLISS